MIGTLKANNGTFANMGSVQVQPKPASAIAVQAQLQTTLAKTSTSAGVLPIKHAALSVPVLLQEPDGAGLTVFQKPGLAGLAAAVSKDNKRAVFPYGALVNPLMPTHALTLDAGRIYDPRLTQGYVTTATRFQPYEQLTGIAQERPEIVMLTNFQPLFDRDVSHTAPNFIGLFEDAGLYQFMTDAGRYIDAQCTMRNLQSWNSMSSVRTLRTVYPGLDQTFSTRNADFQDALTRLKANASFLLNLVRIIESQKQQLDLRHDIHIVQPTLAAATLVNNFVQQQATVSPSGPSSPLVRMVTNTLPPKYDCVDTLQMLGYTSDSSRNVFSSTKLWMQLLVELKGMLQHHSLRFIDIDPTYQRGDNNPTSILTPPTKYFGLAANLPDLPTLDELTSLEVGNASKTISALQPAFTTIYENALFKNEEARLAAIAHILTQEYRYSYGLSLEPVQRALQNFYGFTVVPNGNTTMFDAVIGKFGNNITDFPASSDQSLASFAQNTVGRGGTQGVGVLTFESKYVEGDTGTLTPGGDFYFDRVLDTDGAKFNTEALDALTTEADDQLSQLSVIIDGLNLMMTPAFPDKASVGTSLISEGGFLTTSSDLVAELSSKLINHAGAPLPVALNDRLGAVYAQARNDNRLKTLLFLYTLSRISRTYSTNIPFFTSNQSNDNTPLVDDLIERLVNDLAATVPASRSAIQMLLSPGLNAAGNTSSMTHDSIKAAMKTGTQLTLIIEQFMSAVLSQFRTKTSAIFNGFTRYGGYLDTVVMMMAFDFAISMVARYSNQTITGQHKGLTTFSQGLTTFVVSQTSTNHSLSISELLQRIRGETGLVQQVLLTFTNTLRAISGSVKGISNYLNSPQAKDQLNEVAAILDRDKDMIRMLFSEQQIMMMASIVESLSQASNYGNVQTQQGGYHDDGTKSSEEVVVLDESEVTAASRDALFGYFGSGEFASQRGLNKRILTVGIPLGFTQRLKQKVSIKDQKRASFDNRRNDIVQVTVYKVDVQNPDIVYLPRRYMFEMSRFPIRYTTSQWLPLPSQPSQQDVVNAIPTQCYTQNVDAGAPSSISAGVEYASTAVAQNDGVRGARSAFDDPSYSFLTSAQKSQILQNHVSSQLLEAYIKLMTGINVAEYSYNMVEAPQPIENDFIKTLMEHSIQHVTDQVAAHAATLLPPHSSPAVGGVLFGLTASKTMRAVGGSNNIKALTAPILSNPAGIAGRMSSAAVFRTSAQASPPIKTIEEQTPTGNVDANLGTLSHRNVTAAMMSIKTVGHFANTMTSIAATGAINRRVVTPKQFDRVFNVVVDPRDFEIDVVKTSASPYGKQALDLLLKHGDVVSSDSDAASVDARFGGLVNVAMAEGILSGRGFSQGGAQPNINNFRFRDRDKNQGDLIADKYFVTIETFGEDEV